MKTTLRVGTHVLYNPTDKIISKVLQKSPTYFEMSLYLMKSRIEPSLRHHIFIHGSYRTKSGGLLVLKNNMVYLTLGKTINSIRELNHLRDIFEKSKQEVLIHYPIYPENIKKNESFQRMLGAAWKKNS